MKINSVLSRGSLFIVALAFNTSTHAAIDVSASTISLQTNCTENSNVINNCFTDLNALNTWTWNTRIPSPSPGSPLKIEVGPGTFNGTFSCTSAPELGEDFGSVTIQGSGIHNTVLQNSSGPISTSKCNNMVFSDMTLKNTVNLFGVKNLGGTTVWNNIRIEGKGYAWFDSPNPCNTNGTHYWFNSTIIATPAAGSARAYYTACDESWFYGSEIISRGSSGTITPIFATGGEVHVYGSVIRALPTGNASAVAVTATNGSEVHIHGTGIDVIGTDSNNITALAAATNGSIHANSSSYVMQTGEGGNRTRISNNGGIVKAPYQWETAATPPAINTVTGSDTAIITATDDNHPHLTVSDNSCASKWFDINANSCL